MNIRPGRRKLPEETCCGSKVALTADDQVILQLTLISNVFLPSLLSNLCRRVVAVLFVLPSSFCLYVCMYPYRSTSDHRSSSYFMKKISINDNEWMGWWVIIVPAKCQHLHIFRIRWSPGSRRSTSVSQTHGYGNGKVGDKHFKSHQKIPILIQLHFQWWFEI